MIDLNHKKPDDTSARINDLIDAAIINVPQEVRNYLGASSLGKSCSRQIQYEYLKTPKDEGAGFSARTYRIFQIGHILEAEIIRYFRNAGFDLRNEKPGGGQFGFEVAGGRIAGHIDGVFCGGPDVGLQYPALWECKTMSAKKWNAFVKHGVAKSSPVYAAQIALYQAYMDLPNPAVLTAINKDDSSIYHEIVPFDGKLAQDTSDKAVNILKAGTIMLSRISDDPDWFECKWCDYRKQCHGI